MVLEECDGSACAVILIWEDDRLDDIVSIIVVDRKMTWART